MDESRTEVWSGKELVGARAWNTKYGKKKGIERKMGAKRGETRRGEERESG